MKIELTGFVKFVRENGVMLLQGRIGLLVPNIQFGAMRSVVLLTLTLGHTLVTFVFKGSFQFLVLGLVKIYFNVLSNPI